MMIGNINGQLDPSYSFVVPCRRDGYTRLNNFPTATPTIKPTYKPSPGPPPTYSLTQSPSQEPLCCDKTYYGGKNKLWQQCSSASSVKSVIRSCSTCMSYQCIDWTVGSSGMKARQDAFFQRTKQNVYFGVGAYGYTYFSIIFIYQYIVKAMTQVKEACVTD